MSLLMAIGNHYVYYMPTSNAEIWNRACHASPSILFAFYCTKVRLMRKKKKWYMSDQWTDKRNNLQVPKIYVVVEFILASTMKLLCTTLELVSYHAESFGGGRRGDFSIPTPT